MVIQTTHNKLAILTLCCFFAFSIHNFAWGQDDEDEGQSKTAVGTQYAKGLASQAVSGRWLSKACKGEQATDNDEYMAVVNAAKANAMRAWAAQKSIAFSDLFARAEDDVMADIDRYLLNPNVRQNCKGKELRIKVTGEINEGAISQLMASKRTAVQGPRSRMTAVFVARRQASVKSYDAKVTKISEQKEFSEAEQTADVSGASMSASGMSSSRTVITTGGSTERKADKITYDVFQADGLDAAVNQTFASSGYRAIDASQVAGRFPGFDLNALRAEFAVGDDLSPETKNAAFNAIAGKIPLLVIATVDVEVGIASGASEDIVGSTVKVKGTVYQDDGLFYEVVASVAPMQVYQEGRSQTAAETAALKKAALQASEEIINQLFAQGIY